MGCLSWKRPSDGLLRAGSAPANPFLIAVCLAHPETSSRGTWRVSSGTHGLQVLQENRVLVGQVLWEAGGEISGPAQCQRVRKMMGVALSGIKEMSWEPTSAVCHARGACETPTVLQKIFPAARG